MALKIVLYIKRVSQQVRDQVCNYEHFSKKIFSKNGVCKSRIKLCFHNKSVQYSGKLHGNVNYLIKAGVFLLLVIICVPPIIIDNQFLT